MFFQSPYSYKKMFWDPTTLPLLYGSEFKSSLSEWFTNSGLNVRAPDQLKIILYYTVTPHNTEMWQTPMVFFYSIKWQWFNMIILWIIILTVSKWLFHKIFYKTCEQTCRRNGQNLVNSRAGLAILHYRTILKKRMNSSFALNHPGVIHPIVQIVILQNK